MAERSFPFDAVDGDRELDTAQWSRLNAAVVPTGGVVPGFGDELAVEATSPETLAVRVASGRMLVEGRFYEVHSEPVVVGLATSDPSNPRIDRIVVRRDLSGRTVTVVAVTGSPAVEPLPAALTRNVGGVWEEPLRQVTVRANATSIRTADLADGQGYLSTVDRQFYRLRSGLPTGDDDVATRGYVLGDGSAGRWERFAGGIPTVDDFTVSWPAGRYEQIRIQARGRLDVVGRIVARINNDVTSGMHRAASISDTPDGSGRTGSAGDAEQWSLGDWGTGSSNSFTLNLYDTAVVQQIAYDSICNLASGSDSAAKQTNSWGNLTGMRLATSVRIISFDGTDFDIASGEGGTRWWAEGLRVS